MLSRSRPSLPSRSWPEFQHWHLLPLDLSLAAGDLKRAPARCLSRTPGGTRVSDGALTPSDLIPGYLGTDQLYLRVFALTRRYLAGDRQYLFV